MEHGPNHAKAIVADIDKVIAEEEIRSATLHQEADSEWPERLEAMHDMEALVWFKVG